MKTLFTLLIVILLGNISCNRTVLGRLSKLPCSVNQVRKSQPIEINKEATKSLTIQYLGTGGLYLVRNNEGILIDPFFSNQKVFRLVTSVLFRCRNIRSSKKKVTFGLNALDSAGGVKNGELKAIFVAHSHYDHLLDVPAVYKETGSQATVYLNQSGYNICNGVISLDKMVVIENHMTTNETQRDPIVLNSSNGKVNIYPILADHNPHLNHIKAFDGIITRPNTCFKNEYGKTRANDWL
jgi:ribonuclease BN (tRNA processing enzyme)